MTDLVLTPFAVNGDQFVPPQTNDPNGFMSFLQGYTPNYELDLSTGNLSAHPVERKNLNYLFFLLTSGLQEWQQYGAPIWYNNMVVGSVTGYPIGSIVRRQLTTGGPWIVFQSLVANNTVDPAASGQTSWSIIENVTSQLANIPMPLGGGIPANEGITVSTDFNTLTSSGTFDFGLDSVVSGSPNAPSSYSGLLEVKAWTVSSDSFVVQRYFDYKGNGYIRSHFSSWTSWNKMSNQSDWLPLIGNFQPYSSAQISTNTNLTATQAGSIFQTSASGINVTLPQISTCRVGTVFYLVNNSGGTNTVTTYSGDAFAISGAFSSSTILTLQNDATAIIALIGGSWFLVGGTAAFQNQAQLYLRNQFDSSAYAASTQFVQRALGNFQSVQYYGSSASIPGSQTGSLIYASTASITLTLPVSTTLIAGGTLTFANISTGSITIDASDAGIVQLGGSVLASITIPPGGVYQLILATPAGSVWVISQSNLTTSGTSITNTIVSSATTQSCVVGTRYIGTATCAYTLPSTGLLVGQIVKIDDQSGGVSSTVSAGSNAINGGTSGPYQLTFVNGSWTFVWSGASRGWVIE